MKIALEEFRKPCSCGKTHEVDLEEAYIQSGALAFLPEILSGPRYANKKKVRMICDENTYKAAGQEIEKLLPGLEKTVLNPFKLHADEHAVAKVEKDSEDAGGADVMLAVGSGTIHDITRYAANELKIPFISVPTAASVDGFVSTVAAMTWKGFKKSLPAASPKAFVADTEIIKKAPFRLTASGVSDLLGKYTALADWKIAHILTGEYICDTICAMEYKALDAMMGSYAELGNGDTKAYEDLMYGLLLSGLAMQMTGNSRPASGAEHHFSHLWEMEVINDPVDFYHGEKVGVGLMITSRVYHETLKHLLEGNYEIKDDVPVETELIHQTYGSQPAILKGILEENTPNPLDIVDAARIRENSDEIEMVLETVPRPEDLGHMIDTVKGVKTLEDLGLDDSMRELSAKISPYVRKRLTFMRLIKYYDFYDAVLKAR